MPNEPCMCGADDCTQCYPKGYVEPEYDEDANDCDDVDTELTSLQRKAFEARSALQKQGALR